MPQPQALSERAGVVSYRRNGKLFSCEPVSRHELQMGIMTDVVQVPKRKAAL
jgi:hypothetical protein